MRIDSSLVLNAVKKTFGDVEVLSDVTLVAEPGAVLGLTGPSAAGKTTTCRLISGLESPSAGEILCHGRRWNGVPPQQRNVSYMFESYALYPQFTVFDNIAFPHRAPGKKGRFSEADIAARVRDVIALTEMQGLERRFPGELSGGQKQRVALCRALVQEPSIFVLDEPISHLDAKLRHKLRGEIRRRQTAKDVPTLWSTPDAMEALSVSDRIAVIVDGRIQQAGTPEDVYLRPATVSVARLIGDPAMNLIPGELSRENGSLGFRFGAGRITLSERLRRQLDRAAGGERILLGVRATDLSLADASAGHSTAAGTVYTFEPFGKYSIVTVRLGDNLIKIKSTAAIRFEIEEPVTVQFLSSDFVAFDEVTGRAL